MHPATTRHNIVQQACHWDAFASGISTSTESSSWNHAAEVKKPGSQGYGNRGDILFSFMADLMVRDVSGRPPGVPRVSAVPVERAAAMRPRRKTQQHSELGSHFVPLVSESYGRLCVEADDFLHELATVTSRHG
jgi:hypothetical protein